MARRRLYYLSAALGVATAVLVLVPGGVDLNGQNKKSFSIYNIQGTHVGLGLAVRKLGVAATFMNTPSHPDDEQNAFFTYFGYGQGMRVIDVQNNRGEGGQNEIGPEIMHDIGMLRTEELMAVHREDGAEQYFTRAIDYGYSYDPLGEIIPWIGEKEIVGDYVRLFRMLRPDVVVSMNVSGQGGDRMHEAQTIMTREAYAAAGDPNQYPEQIREGLRPWQPTKFYYNGASIGGARGYPEPPAPGPASAHLFDATWFAHEGSAPQTHPVCTPINSGAYDPLLGRTYAEIASEAHGNHKCQGTGGPASIPGVAGGRGGGRGAGPAGFGGRGGGGYYLVDSTLPGQLTKPSETGLFEGIDTTVNGLARFAGATPPAALVAGLKAIADQASRAKEAFASGNDAATTAPIEAGLTAVRALRSQLGSMGLTDSARYEIDFRLQNEEQDSVNAVIQAHGLEFFAASTDGLVVAGQPINVNLALTNRGATDANVTSVEIKGFDSPAVCTPGTSAAQTGLFACAVSATIPKDAKATTPYWHDTYWSNPVKSNPARNTFDPGVEFGVPFAPTPFRAVFHVKAGGVEFTRDMPFTNHYMKDIYFGDKQMEINVIPAFAAQVTPAIGVVPTAARVITRDVFVAVTNGMKAAAQANVTLDVPAGWTVTPASAPVQFSREDESLSAKFRLSVPAGTKPGDYSVKAVVTSSVTGADKFSTYYSVVEYPHTEYRQTMKDAVMPVKVIKLQTTTVPIKVGYVMGMGDLVPPALQQLGVDLTFLDDDELAFGDFKKYDVVMLGVRAYLRREHLAAYNQRVLDYAKNGGTVLVNYNKGEFNGFGPYPGGTTGGGRVNDENAEVKVLVPSHPVFNFPNKIGPEDWAGWSQERGQYLFGFPPGDKNYIPLVSMTDTMKDNPGEKLGGLVEAKVGKGRWIYLGLNFWRQLPQGTPGAYRLMANLLALPKAPVAAAVPKTAGRGGGR
jgi:LmbE family N-acetylglucosaminyl deacetylase